MGGRKFPIISLLPLALFLLLSDSAPHHTQFILSPKEQSALIHLQSSLALRNADWPSNSEPCTSWKGIECTNGSVTGINLSGLNRTPDGIKNPSFSVDGLRNLTMLSSFKATNFPLPGPIPHWFGQILRSLQVLDIGSCSINGTIPSTLGDLIELALLDLSNNNLVGLIPSALFLMPGLVALDLSRNWLKGPMPIDIHPPGSNSGLLHSLDVSRNNLSGAIPRWIGSLSRLQRLDLSGNALSSTVPAELANLSNLVDLNLGSNALFGSIPENLWSLPSLQFLDLSRNNLTGSLPITTNKDSGNNNNETGTLCDISQNEFYGSITAVIIKRFNLANMSWNYLEGEFEFELGGDDERWRVEGNCLRNRREQRNATECTRFYQERKITREEEEDSSSGSNNNDHRGVGGGAEEDDHRGLWGNAGTVVAYVVFVGFLALMFWIFLLRMGRYR